jgi:uncharacterized protein YgiM (DUF1202 family)
MYLSVILGSALVFTASASVTGTMLQSFSADPGPARQVRSLASIHVPAPPAGKAPVPLMPLPAPDEAAFMAPAPTPATEANMTPPEELFVVTSGVNVRAGASKNAERLASLEAGEEVGVVERDGNWARVARDGDVLGWVYSGYLEAID